MLFRVSVALALAISCLFAPLAQAQTTSQSTLPLVDVALDPGHSRADVGASGGGLREFELTLDMAFRTRALLEAEGYTVRLTREDHAPLTDMRNPDETERIRLEQTARIDAGMPARVFVSLHFNGGPASLRGTETYFNPDRSGLQPDPDAQLAEALQSSVLGALRAYGYGTPDRGVKSDLWAGKPYGHFFSLRGPVPSALVESLFLSNPAESGLLRDDVDASRDAIARGVADGIRAYLTSTAPVAEG